MKKISALFKQKAITAKNLPFLLFFSAALTFSAGCFTGGELYNVHWKPVDKAPDGVFLLFTADKRRVVGCCGANRFFGPVKVSAGKKLEVGMLGATRMASPHYRYEQKFLDNLQSVKSYRFESDGTLTLLDVDGKSCLRLKAAPPPEGTKKQ